jgi:probable rRNA maturation factor
MILDIINNYTNKYKFDNNLINTLIKSTTSSEDKKINSINLILTDDEFLRKMKNKYFEQDLYTDVISFNLEDPNEDIEGEIYISMDRIIDNAKSLKSSINMELKRIIIHGTLHLIGYKDTTNSQKKNMTRLENKYLEINPKKVIIN